jgi:hypothetical protein
VEDSSGDIFDCTKFTGVKEKGDFISISMEPAFRFLTTTGKGKGKVHPITGHEGSEVE